MYKECVLEAIVENVKQKCSQNDKDIVKSALFEHASSKKDIPDSKRKIMYKLFKMLKYNLEYNEVEDEDKIIKEKEKENVIIDPVNDYILKKNYTSHTLKSNNKLKRQILNSALKHKKRTQKILKKMEEDSTNAKKLNFEENNEEEVNNNDKQEQCKDKAGKVGKALKKKLQVVDAVEDESISDNSSSEEEEYIIKNPKLQSSITSKNVDQGSKILKNSSNVKENVGASDTSSPSQIKSPKQTKKKDGLIVNSTSQELKETKVVKERKDSKEKDKLTSSPITKSNKKSEKLEKIPAIESLDKEDDGEHDKILHKLDTKYSSPSAKILKDETSNININPVPSSNSSSNSNTNKKLKTVIIDEDNLVEEKKTSKSKPFSKVTNLKTNKNNKVDESEENEDFDEYYEENPDDFEDSDENYEEEEEYDEQDLAQIGNEILRKYMRFKMLKSKGKLTPEEEEELEDDDFELDEDFDFMDFAKPAYEEEDEVDDEGNDPKLNENLKLAYLQSLKNVGINSKIKVNMLGKKRNFINNLSDKKNKKQATDSSAKGRKTKVNFKIGLNNFNGTILDFNINRI